MSMYDNMLEKLSVADTWSAQNEAVSSIFGCYSWGWWSSTGPPRTIFLYQLKPRKRDSRPTDRSIQYLAECTSRTTRYHCRIGKDVTCCEPSVSLPSIAYVPSITGVQSGWHWGWLAAAAGSTRRVCCYAAYTTLLILVLSQLHTRFTVFRKQSTLLLMSSSLLTRNYLSCGTMQPFPPPKKSRQSWRVCWLSSIQMETVVTNHSGTFVSPSRSGPWNSMAWFPAMPFRRRVYIHGEQQYVQFP